MKPCRTIVFALMLLAALVPAIAQRGPNPDLIRRLDEVMMGWEEALRTTNVGSFAEHYWDDAVKVLVFPNGGRHVLHGRDAIAEQQEAFFRSVRREDPDAFRRYRLPEHEIEILPEHLPVFVYRPEDSGMTEVFQFEQRGDHVAISRHVLMFQGGEPVEAPSGFWGDENEDGVVDPPEQQFVMDQYIMVTSGPHRAVSFLDNYFDWDGNRQVDEPESQRARTVLYRDGLRQGKRHFPEFTEIYIDLDHSGSASIYEADLALSVVFTQELEVPRPVSTPIDERLDLDMDGWIIFAEVTMFSNMLTRAVASVPNLPITNPTTPDTAEFVYWWADADENGFLDEFELRDVGTIMHRIVMHTEIVSNPLELRYDADRDFLLSPRERERAHEEIFMEFFPASLEAGIMAFDRFEQLAALDTNENGRFEDNELESFLELAVDPYRVVNRRPTTPAGHLMDLHPEDNRIQEHEVFIFLEGVFASIAETWFLSSPEMQPEILTMDRGLFEESTGLMDKGAKGLFDEPASESSTRIAGVGGDEEGAADDERADEAESVTVLSATQGAPRPTETVDQVGDDLSISVTLNPVFPVLRKYYDTSPLGTVTIANTGSSDLSNITVAFSVGENLADTRTYSAIDSLAAGNSTTVDLTLLFNSSVLESTQGDRVNSTVSVAYSGNTGQQTETATETMILYDRNAIRWDDDRKVVAFVTDRDEEVRSYARDVVAAVYRERNDAIDLAFQDAMAVFIGLVEAGALYFYDPSSSYASASANAATIDYVQFPIQTLTDHGGDCDDLSVAYAALLESLGHETAFLTVPGHIMPAVRLKMNDSAARAAFQDSDDLIFESDGSVWLPVEVTALDESFYKAWQAGAKRWNENDDNGTAVLIRTETARTVYESVQSVIDDEVDEADNDSMETEFIAALAEFIGTEISNRETQYKAALTTNPNDQRVLNRLGVLYAQYGQWDDAKEQFEAIVTTTEYLPALLNLGHIAFLDDDFRTASRYYERVLDTDGAHPRALLAASRAHHELSNYGNVQTYYAQLKTLSPVLATEYSYLDYQDLDDANDTARAQAADEKSSTVIWENSEADE